MSTSKVVKHGAKFVKPILSIDSGESRRRVINLYKAWYRQIPYIVLDYDIPKSIAQCREKLKFEFRKNAHVKDIRVIDILIIKGQMELKEIVNKWKQKGHLLTYWKDTHEPKSTDFLMKFLSGSN